jgi:hypothetical protein
MKTWKDRFLHFIYENIEYTDSMYMKVDIINMV